LNFFVATGFFKNVKSEKEKFLILLSMKIHIKYDINISCKIILQEQLDKLQLPYTITGLGEIEIIESVSPAKYIELETNLNKYAIEIIDDPKNVFTQKIKDAIVEMVYLEEALSTITTSEYLAKKLNKNYNYISAIFSEVTFTSIQNFIILQKIERVKQEIIEGKDTFTEIAWKLNFSSVAHLSNEFKKITGLTPTAFQRIIIKRKETDFTSEQ
jgi:AraC-like DNA-binding protein